MNRPVAGVAIALILLSTIAVYWAGLAGPFLFDDNVHIVQNRWLKIDNLSIDSLTQAWNSSVIGRPLAQLTFGINHALSGLDAWAFKATNLAVHLLTGFSIFVFARLGLRAVSGGNRSSQAETFFALALMAFWLLHPLHISTVLYVVQRMAQLSTLFLMLALSAYLWGRLRIAENKTGLPWLLATIPLAGIGFLGKENTVLLPLLLLACELTLLRKVSLGRNPWLVRAVWMVLIALPLIAGAIHLLDHPGLLNHDGRPFTFEERILTQPRILWLYIQWLFVPDISQLGLFHDDIPTSTSLLDPPTTPIAIAAWVGVATTALVMSKRWPAFAFAVLFFLAAHALESTIFPLEMVFEHRNYLASVGPLFLLAYLVTVAAQKTRFPGAIKLLMVALIAVFGAATFARVQNWTSHEAFVLASAQNHPGSARAQFMAGQLAISMVPKIQGNKTEIANVAEQFLEQGLRANDRCLNCLFGLVVLDLHLGRAPAFENLDRLTTALREGPVDASLVSVSQFSFLVNWVAAGDSMLTAAQLKSIFDAALANPSWNNTGRASIEAAYRKYYELVTNDLESARMHAEAAIKAWPSQWAYRVQLVEVLLKMERFDEAREALVPAAELAKNAKQNAEVERLLGLVERSVAE